MKSCDILVVEDDPKLQELILQALASLGTGTMVEENGIQGEARAREYLPSVIVLDLGLPGQSGIELLRRVRGWFKGSVVVVTAWEDETKKLEAFDLGADDYVQKPFSPNELLARVKVALRRASKLADQENGGRVVTVANLAIDRDQHHVTVDGQAVTLTQMEFRFLFILANEVGNLISQKRLLHEIWGPNHALDTHYLRIVVSRLRKKLVESQAHVEVVTEPGIGYRLIGE